MFLFTEVNLKAAFNPGDSDFDFFHDLRQKIMYDMN